MSIAHDNGLFWEALWNHPNNSSLKSKRRNPDVLLPGDVVHIPDRIEKSESGAAEQLHKFKRKGTPSLLHLAFRRPKKDEGKVESESTDHSEYRMPEPKGIEDEPMKDVPFALYADGLVVKEGKTDGDGKLKVEIPTGTIAAWIVLEPGSSRERTVDLNIRGMDPVDEIPGICKRLNNLGFPCPTEVTEITPVVADALRAFQRKNTLDPTGQADDKTKNKLKELHGS
jgi:N-acetylmuramoyl-L-alanine amidase